MIIDHNHYRSMHFFFVNTLQPLLAPRHRDRHQRRDSSIRTLKGKDIIQE